MDSVEYEFDFAISYASENEKTAQDLCGLLQESGAKVFFAKEQVGNLWGTNLLDTLRKIFQEKSRFCILLISEAYVKKYWTLYEWHRVRERLTGGEQDVLLAIRLDPIDVPGLPPEISYLSLEDFSLEEIAGYAIDKLQIPGINIPPNSGSLYRDDEQKVETVWSRTGSLFWISTNLQWTYWTLMQQGAPEEIRKGFKQCYHFAKRLNLGEDILAVLAYLQTESDNLLDQEWDAQRRGRFGFEIRNIFEAIAKRAEENEGDFSPAPEFNEALYKQQSGFRIFVAYARVDKSYSQQIIRLLDIYDIWYDQRLHVGEKWWDEIVRRLHWCDVFLYLMSPDSVASEYCQHELEIALKLKKVIFPVLIQRGTVIPAQLTHLQYIDLSDHLEVQGIKALLTALWRVERETVAKSTPPLALTPQQSQTEGSAFLDEAVRAFERCDYDKAVFLLKKVQESNYTPRFISIATMLRQAEAGLERQAYLRDAQREYAPIARMMRNESSRSLGCTSFRAFQASFPDYDPENLAEIYEQTIGTRPPFDLGKSMPPLEWCRIPAGKVMIERNLSKKALYVPEYDISKYPVTNMQFQVFIDAPDGYRNSAWWQSSPDVQRWHVEHATAIAAPSHHENYPRAFVCWYEALAFCQWLSFKTGNSINLTSEEQWQRSAQGDTSWRYPWGVRFDPFLCNTKETELRSTTPVTQYPRGASPFGVCDLLGNVWEWCANGRAVGAISEASIDIQRVVRGGSFLSSKRRTNINFFYYLNPLYRYQSIGFRIAREVDASSK